MKRLTLALAIMFFPLAGAAQGTPQTPGSQILVSQCHPHIHAAGETHPFVDPYGVWHYTFGTKPFPSSDAFLAITYRNQAPTAAKEIDFGLVSRGSLIAVAKDIGTFSPGAKIAHEFVVSRAIFPIGPSFCEVLHVKYTNGSSWSNTHPDQM